ncbi:MAG: tripartite tricarboxylate transporter substrate binding protein, partial [Limnohabitans sp.]|nr:tripartite tricarboxylate transporter substrate binding protein [Limnohabitans sp.]
MARRQLLKALTALAVGCTLTAGAWAQSNYPNRPITLVVPWGAGGGTDATARIVGTLLEKELGQPVNVVNRTGGNGVVGHSAISTAAPDGYTLGMITVEITMMHWAGLTPMTYRDFTPLSLMNIDPAGVTVRADAPYKNLDDLIKAVRANPGKFKASGTGQGGIWHLALAGMLSDLKIDGAAVPWVPSNGAA